MTKYVDTNILLRLTQRDHKSQYNQIQKNLSKNNTEFVVTPAVLFEVEYVLRGRIYNYTREVIQGYLMVILEMQAFRIEHIEALRQTLRYYLEKPELDIVDCYLAARAKVGNGEVWTFDKDLKKLKL